MSSKVSVAIMRSNYFEGYMGVVAYDTEKSRVEVCSMGVIKPEKK